MPTSTHVHAAPIRPGLAWSQALEATGAFPVGARFSAHVRRTATGADLAVLTSENGGFVRTSDDAAYLAWAVPADLATGKVVISIKRTDLAPDHHLGVELHVPVVPAGTE